MRLAIYAKGRPTTAAIVSEYFEFLRWGFQPSVSFAIRLLLKIGG
jgi:hypothetical protein